MTNQRRKESFSDRILRTRPSIHAFYSGALLAISVNLYTTVFSADVMPSRWIQVLISTLLTGISAVLWAILAWKLETIQDAYADDQRRVLGADVEWDLLVKHRRARLLALFWSAILVAIAGLVVIPLGIKLPLAHTDSSDKVSHQKAHPLMETNVPVGARGSELKVLGNGNAIGVPKNSNSMMLETNRGPVGQ